MLFIENSSQSIGGMYPQNTGRLKRLIGISAQKPAKVALLGDSTLDNGYWVQKEIAYADKTHTVTHQTAVALANKDQSRSYDIGNFAVDGATTADLMRYCYFNKVLPYDEDHTSNKVHQLIAVHEWAPDVAVLSVAGNNYREALMGSLTQQLSYMQLLLRITPEEAKPNIRLAFEQVKETLLREYKNIIDQLVVMNPQLKRIVLLSQYYPALTEFTPYFIYTGFSHLARAEQKGQSPFTAVEETMNELYREVLNYAATKNQEIVFADVTSSLNPLGGNHTVQIEPNERGSVIIGRLIAEAIDYSFPSHTQEHNQKSIAILRMSANEQHIQSQLINKSDINNFKVKKIEEFIRENRYRHLGLLFSPSSNLTSRYENTYHLVMGKQFDSEYTGLFAFGLIDLSLVTIIASYLWRVAINEESNFALRVTAGAIAAPVLLSKLVVGLSLMLVLALPVYGYHQLIGYLSKSDPEFSQEHYSFIDDDIKAVRVENSASI